MSLPLQPRLDSTARSAARAVLIALTASLCLAYGGAIGASLHAALPRGSAQAATLAGHGRLLLATQHSVVVHNFASGAEQPVVQLPADHFLRSPLWAPDGRSFFYLDQRPFLGEQTSDWGTDIWQANADGSNRHIVFLHDGKGADIDQISLAGDGRTLVFGYTRFDLSPSGELLDQILQVRKLDLSSGAVSVVADQAGEPAISADGSSVAYLDVADSDNGNFGLWVRNVDGSNPRPVATRSAGLIAFLAPRFSTDGRSLLFAGVAAADAGGPVGCTRRCFPGPAVAHADGPPQDIWTVALDGTALTRVTTLLEDQPSAAWSVDGRQIAVYASGGLYLMNADGSGLSRLGEGVLHGQLDWYDHP